MVVSRVGVTTPWGQDTSLPCMLREHLISHQLWKEFPPPGAHWHWSPVVLFSFLCSSEHSPLPGLPRDILDTCLPAAFAAIRCFFFNTGHWCPRSRVRKELFLPGRLALVSRVILPYSAALSTAPCQGFSEPFLAKCLLTVLAAQDAMGALDPSRSATFQLSLHSMKVWFCP